MGQLTRAAIISQGLKLAAREDLATAGPDGLVPAEVEFKAWLQRMAGDWPWPRLHRRANGISLPAGTASLTLGAGSTITNGICEVRDPLKIYNASFSVRDLVRVRTVDNSSLDIDEAINNPATNRGLPKHCIVRPYEFTTSDISGRWMLYFLPVPDQAYTLSIPYLMQPADPGATDIPWYPVDSTMIHQVMTFAMKLSHSPNYPALNEELGAKVDRDKMDFGQSPGINQQSGLDTRWYPQGRTSRYPQWPSDR